MFKHTRIAVVVRIVLRLTVMAALSGTAGTGMANEENVTFVEAVQCAAGACSTQRRTVPTRQIVRAPDVGDYCVEYTRTLTGFTAFPSVDPAVAIQIPRFQEGERRYFRCAREVAAAVNPPAVIGTDRVASYR